MYHPEPDGAAEFIELMNISDSQTLDLAGVKFTQGITFNFTGSAITNLAPGARVLVVKDTASFEAAHGAGKPVAGVFALGTSLSNGGEFIKLEDAGSGTIKEFRYDDVAPWPTRPDTQGYSLVLISPATNPDPTVATNWRASTEIGGSPGGSDGTTFTGDPAADDDQDGLDALVEYALGSDDTDASSGPGAFSTGSLMVGESNYATFSYRYNPAAADAILTVQASINLADWEDESAGIVEVDSVTHADGTVTKTMRRIVPISEDSVRYFRLLVELR
jgi:hypothetical protein